MHRIPPTVPLNNRHSCCFGKQQSARAKIANFYTSGSKHQVVRVCTDVGKRKWRISHVSPLHDSPSRGPPENYLLIIGNADEIRPMSRSSLVSTPFNDNFYSIEFRDEITGFSRQIALFYSSRVCSRARWSKPKNSARGGKKEKSKARLILLLDLAREASDQRDEGEVRNLRREPNDPVYPRCFPRKWRDN